MWVMCGRVWDPDFDVGTALASCPCCEMEKVRLFLLSSIFS